MDEVEIIYLPGVPMSPQSNHQYVPLWRLKRLVPSAGLNTFKNNMNLWATLNKRLVDGAKEKISKWHGINISVIFEFPYARLITKEGQLKRLDVSNRIKALHDCLGDILGFDDKWIIKCQEEKVVGETEQCHVQMQAATMRYI